MLKNLVRFAARARSSLRWRTFRGYCGMLRRLKSINPPKIEWKTLDESLPIAVSMACETDVPMLYYSVRSLMQNTPRRPRLLLVGDSDKAYAKLKVWFGNRPSDVKILHWQTLFSDLEEQQQRPISAWLSRGECGGIAKKFAAILALNSQNDFLFFDSDMLWFGDFFTMFKQLLQTANTVYAAKDYQQSYNIELAKLLGDPRILEEEPYNSGFVYYPRGVLPRFLTAEILEKITPFLEGVRGYHIEQTITAYVFWQSGGRWLNEDTVVVTVLDDFKLKNEVKAIVRHYAGAKHLFWRDA